MQINLTFQKKLYNSLAALLLKNGLNLQKDRAILADWKNHDTM